MYGNKILPVKLPVVAARGWLRGGGLTTQRLSSSRLLAQRRRCCYRKNDHHDHKIDCRDFLGMVGLSSSLRRRRPPRPLPPPRQPSRWQSTLAGTCHHSPSVDVNTQQQQGVLHSNRRYMIQATGGVPSRLTVSTSAAATTTTTTSLSLSTLATTTDSSDSGGGGDRPNSNNKSISLYEMNAEKIRQITDLQVLGELVNQLESMTLTTHPKISAQDIGPLVLPLIRMTSMEKHGEMGAILTERILFHCLSWLPPKIQDRDVRVHPYPTNSMYNRAIMAWGTCATLAAAERAQKIFDYMKSEYKLEWEYHHAASRHPPSEEIRPHLKQQPRQQQQHRHHQDRHHRERQPPGLVVVEEEMGSTGIRYGAPAPCRRSYKSLIRAWGSTGSILGLQRADELLEELERQSGIIIISGDDEQQQPQKQLPVSDLVPTPEPHLAPQRQQQQQQVARSLRAQNQDQLVLPLQDNLSNTRNNHSVGTHHLLNKGPLLLLEPPDRGTYNIVMSAYAKSNVQATPHALDRVKSLVERLDQLHRRTQDEEYMLDWISYHSLLRAYSMQVSYAHTTKVRPQLAYEIEQVLLRIGRQEALGYGPPITPHLSMSWAYGVWIDALLKTEPALESLERAHCILLGMANKPGGLPLPVPLNRRYAERDQRKTQDQDQDNWPRQDNIVRVVRAWDRSGAPDKAERIQDVVQLVVETPYSRVHFLDEAMEVWVQSGWSQSPGVVESMLRHAIEHPRINQVRPTGKTFAIAIKSWLKCRSDAAPYRAELLLCQLDRLYQEQGGKWYEPREVHLRYVMTAWLSRCRTGRKYRGMAGNLYPAQHAEGLMELFGKADWLYIDNLSGLFAMAIQTWSLQKLDPQQELELDPVQRSLSLLNEFEKQIGRGSAGDGKSTGTLPAFPCNYVLATCARPQPTAERSVEAYRVAEGTFRRGKRNARTFALMARVLRAQHPATTSPVHELHAVMEQLFMECCNGGLLSQEMIWELADVLSSESLQKLFGLSYSYAEAMVHARSQQQEKSKHPNNPSKSTTEKLSWSERCRPKALLIENLPLDWSQNATKGKVGCSNT